MSLRGWVERHWAGEQPLGGVALRALSVGFAGVSKLRGRLYDQGVLREERGPVPVISVGNLTVGGTGKTPVVRWVVDLLKAEGCKPAVVLRGYGGDETLLHRRWHPDVPVVEAPRRIEGVRAAAAAGANVVVCDDAFQHRALARDLDIVLLSADDTRPERLLPAGPYRESRSALKRADLVFVTRKGKATSGAKSATQRIRDVPGMPPVHAVTLDSSGWMRLSGTPCTAPGGPVLVVTGVASPGTVEALIAEQLPGSDIEVVAFPDHHAYTPFDVQSLLSRAGSRAIATTEKDAVKLLNYKQLESRTWVIGLTVSSVEHEGAVRTAIHGACVR